MQNSGLGNAINPLLSLCDPAVYSIPMVVMIGWRGEPGLKDEPQHKKQGEVQLELLKAMDIDYEIISKSTSNYFLKVTRVLNIAKIRMRPVVLLVKKGTFKKSGILYKDPQLYPMLREEALEIILNGFDENTIIVSTTGKTSREIYEIRERKKSIT